MPQMNDVVLTDGTDNHTFKPRGIDPNGVATLVESSGVPMGDKRVTIARSRTANGREKVTMKIVVPVMQNQVVNGVTVPTIPRTAYADVVFSFDAGSDIVERNDLRNLAQSLLETTAAVALIDNLEFLY